VLFSANPQSRSAYQQLFPTRQIDKFYEAIAPALPNLTFPLVHKSRLVDGEPFFRMQEGPGASNTETAVEVRETHGDLWRYGLFPVTGKKHQLRVHMTALGASICNDPFYPEVIKDAVDDYANPLKLLAQGCVLSIRSRVQNAVSAARSRSTGNRRNDKARARRALYASVAAYRSLTVRT